MNLYPFRITQSIGEIVALRINSLASSEITGGLSCRRSRSHDEFFLWYKRYCVKAVVDKSYQQL